MPMACMAMGMGLIMFKMTFRIFMLAAVTVIAVSGAAHGQGRQQDGKGLPVDTRHLVVLTKTAIIAVNQANQTGNYSVLHALAAPAFRDKNSPKDLEKIFAKLRESNLDLSPVVIYNPSFTDSPQMMSNGLLRLRGHFPTEPLRVHFDLIFQPVGGEWRLFGISLNPAKRSAPAGRLR